MHLKIEYKRLVSQLLLRLSLVTLPLFVVSFSLHAQQSTRGREFYLSFLPNYHAADNATQRLDSLYIYIVATVPTKGSIVYTNRAGQTLTQAFNITDPTRIFQSKVGWANYELLGYIQREATNSNNDNEKIAKQSVYVRSDSDVVVYALNKAEKSSDATLVLPISCWGTDYRILSYKSDGVLFGRSVSGSYTPSQFCVVAGEDNTEVTITPSVPTSISGRAVKKFSLQKGQVYLVQSEFSTTELRYDLSGSSVSSSKPIAVFSGHQRSRIPVENAQLVSRDCLYEQLLPLSVWGTKYVLTPFAQPSGGTSTGNDLYRVIASEDNTVVSFNGKVLTTLARNAVYEGPLTSAGLLSSTHKIMVALYKKTANTGASTSADGDPFMMIIPPRRQYSNFYRFTNVQVSGVYRQQFITVIAAEKDINSIRLDGNLVKVPFNSIPNSCYYYASLSMTDGAHTIQCPSPVGLYVYGYGAADSYGYVGGMDFIPDVEDNQIDVGPGRSICRGEVAVLKAKNAASNIRWTPSTGLSCDTCVLTNARPITTTKYTVTGVDSAGCISTDTITIVVRDLPVYYSLGPLAGAAVVSTPIGSEFQLAVNGTSVHWDSVQITSLQVQFDYEPTFMQYQDSVRIGSALDTTWKVVYIDSLSNQKAGRIVFIAQGDSIIHNDGILLVPRFKSLLSTLPTYSPVCTVQSFGRTVSCARDLVGSIVIQTNTCAPELRQVLLSESPTMIKSISPNPSVGGPIRILFHLATEAQTGFKLYNIHGEEVASLGQDRYSAGEHEILTATKSLSDGIYCCVMQAAGITSRVMFVVSNE